MFGRRRASPPDPAALEEAREQARQFVLPGFMGLDEARQAVAESMEDATALDERQLHAVVDEVWQARLAEQRSWSDEGDYGRLATAFAELESDGFVARMNFACCQNCGHTEIKDERTGAETAYVFFHQQDGERLAEPDAALYLAYSLFARDHPAVDQELLAAARDGDEAARVTIEPLLNELESQVGARVVQALDDQGLDVSWGGTWESRPAVSITDWRKRLPV